MPAFPRVYRSAIVVLTIVLSGCSKTDPTTVPVSGRVTFDGQPIATGSLTFLPENAKLRPEGTKIQDGRFELRLPPGRMRLEVSATRPAPNVVVRDMGPSFENYVPPEYAGPETVLKVEVTPAGPNVFELALWSDGRDRPKK